MAGDVVGWFEVRQEGEHSNVDYDDIEILGNDQFMLGRDEELCRIAFYDHTISRQHLRIHCLIYDQTCIEQIAPLVYATNLSSNGTYLTKVGLAGTPAWTALMRPNSIFLLDDGDELSISDKVTLIYRASHRINAIEVQSLQNAFSPNYLLTSRLLGQGGQGKVFAGLQRKTRKQLACKVMKLNFASKTRMHPYSRPDSNDNYPGARQGLPPKLAECCRELDVLKDLCHPNIISIEKVFWNSQRIFIFQELLTGGDLFSYLAFNNGKLDSIQTAVIIRQVLKAIDYIHAKGIAHRDLKPENILLSSPADGARVIITDFGLARYLPGTKQAKESAKAKYRRMFTFVGTIDYAAPEVHRADQAVPEYKGYSKSVDMWSIGCITSTLLSGDVVFADRNNAGYHNDHGKAVIARAAACDLSFLNDPTDATWGTVSCHAKNFIARLLVVEEEGRMTAPEALDHPWFSRHADDFETLYRRSISGWTPTVRESQFVQRIRDPKHDLDIINKPNRIQDPMHASPPCASSDSGGTNRILTALSTSAHFRKNTPLPCIRDDYQQNQLTSQISNHLLGPESIRRLTGSSHTQLDPRALSQQTPDSICRQEDTISAGVGLADLGRTTNSQCYTYSVQEISSHSCSNAVPRKNIYSQESTVQFAQVPNRSANAGLTQQSFDDNHVKESYFEHESQPDEFGHESFWHDREELLDLMHHPGHSTIYDNQGHFEQEECSLVPETPPSDAFSDTNSWDEALQCPD